MFTLAKKSAETSRGHNNQHLFNDAGVFAQTGFFAPPAAVPTLQTKADTTLDSNADAMDAESILHHRLIEGHQQPSANSLSFEGPPASDSATPLFNGIVAKVGPGLQTKSEEGEKKEEEKQEQPTEGAIQRQEFEGTTAPPDEGEDETEIPLQTQ